MARLAPVTYIISEPCIDIKDKSCIDARPVDCIHEFERMLIIDPEECIDCGARQPECPVEAIFPEDALPDKWNAFVEINYAFPDASNIKWGPASTRTPNARRRPQRADRRASRCRGRHLDADRRAAQSGPPT